MEEDERLAVLEVQLQRISSDMDSEKRTRSNANHEIDIRFDNVDKRLRVIERLVWIALGAILAVDFLPKVATVIGAVATK